MTEEEKRKALEAFMAAEQRRSPLPHSPNLHEVVRKAEERHQALSGFAQQGITWDQIRAVYNEAYDQGQNDILNFRMGFFYSAAAIVYHERYASADTSTFIIAVKELLDSGATRDDLLKRCLETTGLDLREQSPTPRQQGATRKERLAVERMRKTGITPADLEYERKVGYANGRASVLYMDVCRAAVAIILRTEHGIHVDEISSFFDRMEAVTDEEITAEDILERAKEETGVDIVAMIRAANA